MDSGCTYCGGFNCLYYRWPKSPLGLFHYRFWPLLYPYCEVPLRRNIVSFDKNIFWVLLFLDIKASIEGEISLQPFLLVGTILQLVYWISQFFGVFQLGRWIDRTNFWHELVSLQVTESGRELETVKVNLKVKWGFYSHFLETENLFVIYFYEPSNIPHLFPKKAFNREQSQVFRELRYSKIPPVPQFISNLSGAIPLSGARIDFYYTEACIQR